MKLPGEHHPFYAVECGSTTYWWNAPFQLGYWAIALVLINAVVWGLVGIYEAVRVVV